MRTITVTLTEGEYQRLEALNRSMNEFGRRHFDGYPPASLEAQAWTCLVNGVDKALENLALSRELLEGEGK